MQSLNTNSKGKDKVDSPQDPKKMENLTFAEAEFEEVVESIAGESDDNHPPTIGTIVNKKFMQYVEFEGKMVKAKICQMFQFSLLPLFV